jgi:hypothetical protein
MNHISRIFGIKDGYKILAIRINVENIFNSWPVSKGPIFKIRKFNDWG